MKSKLGGGGAWGGGDGQEQTCGRWQFDIWKTIDKNVVAQTLAPVL